MNFETSPLLLSLIERASDTQARAQLNTDAIEEYKRWLEDGRVEAVPFIDVFFDGQTYHIADGWHRFEAFTEFGMESIPCRIHKGSERDARIFACGANQKHGVRRTPADRRRAVDIMLRDPEWNGKSTKAIADHCGIDRRFVEKVRTELAESTCADAQVEKRVGNDGKVRKKPSPRARQSATESPAASEPSIEGFDAPEATAAPAAPAGNGKPKSGAEKVPVELRKEAKALLAKFTRTVETLGWFDDIQGELESIATKLKEKW